MDNDVEARPLLSKRDPRHSYIRFANRTTRKVDVIWINFEGVRVKYKTLEPREEFDVTSFVTHPWIFLDSETHTKLIVKSKEYFDCPVPTEVRLREGQIVSLRLYVAITLPVYSLKECALQCIQKCLNHPKAAYQLEIPSALQDDLFQRCNLTFNVSKPNQS